MPKADFSELHHYDFVDTSYGLAPGSTEKFIANVVQAEGFGIKKSASFFKLFDDDHGQIRLERG